MSQPNDPHRGMPVSADGLPLGAASAAMIRSGVRRAPGLQRRADRAAGTARDYPGSVAGTPAFLGCSDVDPHIPAERVEETAQVLSALGARVDRLLYPGMATGTTAMRSRPPGKFSGGFSRGSEIPSRFIPIGVWDACPRVQVYR